MEINKKSGLPPQRYIGLKVHSLKCVFFKYRLKSSVFIVIYGVDDCGKYFGVKKSSIFVIFLKNETARIVFCHCGYEDCYLLNKIISYIFFRKSDFFFELHWVLPYHALNSEFANFETPCIIQRAGNDYK
jgi:hypothetical protein